MLELIEQELQKKNVTLDGSKVAVLGAAYLENADDTRNTPAAALSRLLLARGAEVVAHDPYVRTPDWQRALGDGHNVPLTTDLNAALAGADCAAIVTKHREYFKLTPERMCAAMRTPVVADGRNVLDLADCAEAGLVARAVGKGLG